MEESSYAGHILRVDLTDGHTIKEPLEEDLVQKFIGGFGVNLRLAYEHITPGIDPLSPENVIILGAGALTGTMALGSSRIAAVTKFPQNGCIGSSNGSMSFSAWMKWAGYDHIVISGCSTKPAYLYIDDDEVRLLDAGDLWGRDIFQATDILWQRHGRKSGVIAIGQAGENLVPISLTLIDKVASLGKGGLAAVMGSKNLKAIIVKGSKGVGVASGRRFLKLTNEFLKRVRNDPLHGKWVEQGLMMGWPKALKSGFPFRDGEEVFPRDKADELIGLETYLDKVKRSRISCPSCPYADKEIMQVREGEFKGLTVYASAWTMGNINFGIQCQAGNYDRVLRIFDMAQRTGISRHALGHLVDYVAYLYERGKITKEDTGGLDVQRDFETTETILGLIVARQGLGEILGKGLKALAVAFDPGNIEECLISKGLELSLDPRLRRLSTTEFEFIVNPKGDYSACTPPVYSSEEPLDKFRRSCERMGIPGEAIARIVKSPVGFNVGRLERYSEDWVSVLNSLGFCNRTPYAGFFSLTELADYFSSATGLRISPQELMTGGERAWNVYKMLNVREGFNRKHDTYPKKWLRPVVEPNGEKRWLRNRYDNRILGAEDLEKMLNDYYDERGWDIEQGVPSAAKLAELGLRNIIDDPCREKP